MINGTNERKDLLQIRKERNSNGDDDSKRTGGTRETLQNGSNMTISTGQIRFKTGSNATPDGPTGGREITDLGASGGRTTGTGLKIRASKKKREQKWMKKPR